MTFAVLALSVALSACSHLNTRLPDPTVESPVIWGSQGGFGAGLGSRPAHSYEFTPDASARPPDLTSPEVTTSSGAFFGGLNYNLLDRMQVALNYYPLLGGLEPGVKWQIFGEKGSGGQLAVAGSFGYFQTTKTGDQNGEFGPGGYNWEGKGKGTTTRAAISYGHFLTPGALVYFGGAIASNWVQADITHDANSDNTSPAASYSTDDHGTSLSVGGGIEFGMGAKLLLGVTYTDTRYQKTANHYKTQWTLGAAF